MLKSISFQKLAVLSAGIAIVLSSCGLQNTAGESSGDATAAGKTKNFALLADGSDCYDNDDQRNAALDAVITTHANHHLNHDGTGMADPNSPWWITNDVLHVQIDSTLTAQVGGCPVPTPDISAVAEGNILSCLKAEVKKATIEGYTEQLNRPLGGEVTEAYHAEMQRGIDTTKGTCTHKG